MYYGNSSYKAPITSNNPKINPLENEIFVFLCKFENTVQTINISSNNSYIMHSESTFNQNTQPIFIKGNNSIVQHRFLSIKSKNSGSGQHSYCDLTRNSPLLNFIDESSLSECGINDKDHVTYHNYGIIRYLCTNSSSNQAKYGSIYTILAGTQDLNISFSYFTNNIGGDYCMIHWNTYPKLIKIKYINVAGNKGYSILVSQSPTYIENSNFFGNSGITIRQQNSHVYNTTFINCYFDNFQTEGAVYVENKQNHVISLASCTLFFYQYIIIMKRKVTHPIIYKFYNYYVLLYIIINI